MGRWARGAGVWGGGWKGEESVKERENKGREREREIEKRERQREKEREREREGERVWVRSCGVLFGESLLGSGSAPPFR